MATKVKQGDQYALPVRLWANKDVVDPDEIEVAEFMIGGERHLYPTGDVTYDAVSRSFLVPMTQEQTFAYEAGSMIDVDLRVKFTGGDVVGAKRMDQISIVDAISEEVL